MKVLIFVIFCLLVTYAAAENSFKDDPIAGTRASTIPTEFDKSFNKNVNNVLREAISKLDNKMNPYRIPNLKVSWEKVFQANYTNIDLYGLADLFVSSTYIYMTKKHNILLFIRLTNENGLIMKSQGSSFYPGYSKGTGQFTAKGVDKRKLNYFSKLYIDIKTGNTQVEIIEFMKPNFYISIESNNIQDKNFVTGTSEANLNRQIFDPVYQGVLGILKNIDTKPLMQTLHKYLEQAIATEY